MADSNEAPEGLLESIPPEVVAHILSFVDLVSLIRCRMVNKAIGTVASDPWLLRRHTLSLNHAAVEQLIVGVRVIPGAARVVVGSGVGGLERLFRQGVLPDLEVVWLPPRALSRDEMASLPATLQAVMIPAGTPLNFAADLGRLESLNALDWSSLSNVAAIPVESLSRLQRLILYNGKGSRAALVAALATAPCAPVFEALNLFGKGTFALETGVGGSPLWCGSLPDLPALAELAFSVDGEDPAALVDCLSACAALRVLVVHSAGDHVADIVAGVAQVTALSINSDGLDLSLDIPWPPALSRFQDMCAATNAAVISSLIASCPSLVSLRADVGLTGQHILMKHGHRRLALRRMRFRVAVNAALSDAGHYFDDRRVAVALEPMPWLRGAPN